MTPEWPPTTHLFFFLTSNFSRLKFCSCVDRHRRMVSSSASCPATCEHRCQHPGSWGHSIVPKELLEPWAPSEPKDTHQASWEDLESGRCQPRAETTGMATVTRLLPMHTYINGLGTSQNLSPRELLVFTEPIPKWTGTFEPACVQWSLNDSWRWQPLGWL